MGSDLIYIPIYSNNGIVKAVLYDLFSQAEPKNTFVLLFQKQLKCKIPSRYASKLTGGRKKKKIFAFLR